MSWKHTKTLLLLLLLAVNILLCFFAVEFYKSNVYTDSDTAQKAASVFKDSGIEVDYGMIAARNDVVPVLVYNYDREEYLCSVAALLFGKEADGIYMLPDGIRAETVSGDVAFIGYDLSLDYTAQELAAKGKELEGAAYSVPASKLKRECRMLEEKLALPGNSLKDAQCYKSGEYVFINVAQTEEKVPIFEAECMFGLLNGELVYAKGKHLFAVPDQKHDAPIFNRLNILFSEKERGVTGTVSDISLCYTVYENAETSNLMLIPSYAVYYTDGRVHAVNALNKDLY